MTGRLERQRGNPVKHKCLGVLLAEIRQTSQAPALKQTPIRTVVHATVRSPAIGRRHANPLTESSRVPQSMCLPSGCRASRKPQLRIADPGRVGALESCERDLVTTEIRAPADNPG